MSCHSQGEPVFDIRFLPHTWQKTGWIKSDVQSVIVRSTTHSGPALWTKEVDTLVQARWGGKHSTSWRCNIQMRPSHWFLLQFLHRKPASLLLTSGIEPNIKYRWRKQYLSSLQTQVKLTSKIPLSGLRASNLWRQYSWKKQMVPRTGHKLFLVEMGKESAKLQLKFPKIKKDCTKSLLHPVSGTVLFPHET